MCFFISCGGTLTNSVKHESEMDSLRAFLHFNGSDLYSNVSVFFDTSGRSYPISADSIESEAQLLSIINKHRLLFSYRMVADSPVNNDTLEARIKTAVSLRNENKWKLNIPDSIFRNYLLPHKVLYEVYGDWQNFFTSNYGSLKSFVPDKKLSKKQIDSLIETHVIRLDTGHLFTGRTSPLRMSRWPGMDELRIAKSGDCQSESIKNIYLYRSLGIPAAMDFTPFYGGGNAGHSSAVFWNSDTQRFQPKGGQGFNTYYRLAKAFRWSYRRKNIWTKDIVPFIGNKATFPIADLRNDHWFDVTEEHIPTKDITIDISGADLPLAFICTYSYGKWRPIHYGKRLKNGRYLFRKMGLDILYRTAYMKQNSLILDKEILHLQKDGTLKPINIENLPGKYALLKMDKINYGNEAWIKRNGNYSLLALNSLGRWDTLTKKVALQDSTLIFSKIPIREVYLLKDNNARKDLERPFMVRRDSIIWY